MTPMLHSQRQAVERMGPVHRRVHLVLWRLYQPVSGVPTIRRAWGAYRRRWAS